MTKTIRMALVAAVAALALTVTGSAFAAFTPRIFVSGGNTAGGAGPTVDVRVGAADDPTAKVTIYVPNGYQLNSPAAGNKIGDVKATAQAADLGGAILPLTGDLQVVAASQFATQQAQCGVATAAATWNLHLTAAGQVLDVPMWVVQTAGPEQAIGQFKLVVCLPPPDVPAGTPGRATFGAKLLSAAFNVTALTNPASTGEYRWRSVWTPYTPTKGTPNAAGSVETQALVRIPTQLAVSVKKKATFKTVTVKGKKVRRKTTWAVIRATLTENAAGIPSTRVAVRANGKTIATKTTNAAGVVSFTYRLTGKKVITAAATVPERDLGASACTAGFSLPCVTATVGGTTLTSRNSVTVKP